MDVLKKYLVLTLALLITMSASGISISLHKCCGKIKKVSLLPSEPLKCTMHSQVQTSKSCESKHAFNSQHKTKKCCSNQQVLVQKTDEAPAKNQAKEQSSSFDVLFVLTFVRNWLGYTSDEEKCEAEDSPGFSLTRSIIILLKQFRI